MKQLTLLTQWRVQLTFTGSVIRPVSIALMTVLLMSCSTTNPPRLGNNSPTVSEFKISNFAKSDIDRIAEIHQQETLAHLRILMEKLYRRNPREWKKTGNPNLETAITRVFDDQHNWNFQELNNKRGIDSLYLTFQEDYQGDRVLAFISGLATMVLASYNDKTELFILDDLNPQKLYNSARNVEIAVWKLGNTRDSKGELFLLSNDIDGPVRNLSFEREFGKIIGEQDIMARIVAERNNRSIVRVVQSLATALFLPI